MNVLVNKVQETTQARGNSNSAFRVVVSKIALILVCVTYQWIVRYLPCNGASGSILSALHPLGETAVEDFFIYPHGCIMFVGDGEDRQVHIFAHSYCAMQGHPCSGMCALAPPQITPDLRAHALIPGRQHIRRISSRFPLTKHIFQMGSACPYSSLSSPTMAGRIKRFRVHFLSVQLTSES